jgi:hypothetical protein
LIIQYDYKTVSDIPICSAAHNYIDNLSMNDTKSDSNGKKWKIVTIVKPQITWLL